MKSQIIIRRLSGLHKSENKELYHLNIQWHQTKTARFADLHKGNEFSNGDMILKLEAMAALPGALAPMLHLCDFLYTHFFHSCSHGHVFLFLLSSLPYPTPLSSLYILV